MEDGFGVSGAAGYPQSSNSCLLGCWRGFVSLSIDARKAAGSFLWFVRGQFRLAWGNRESRRLLGFIMVLYTFMVVELVYGYFTTSLVLIALVFYTNTTAVSLFLNLISFLCSRHQKTAAYSYGFQRLEIIGGFTDGVFHTIAAGFIIIEALEHIIVEIEEPSYSGLTMISLTLIGMVLNLIGCIVFHSHKLMHATGEQKVKGSREASGFFWNLVTNIATSLGAILACYLVQWGILLADCVMAIVVCLILIACSWPLSVNMGRILLQATPNSIEGRLKRSISEASAVDGVLVCRDADARFWTQSPNEYVGSLHIRVRADADEQLVLAKVHHLFSGWITNLTIQIEKDHI